MDKDTTVISISSGTIIKTIFIVLIIVALFYLRDIVLIFLTSVVLASAIEPGTKWFVRRGLPRLLSVITMYVLLLGVAASLFYFIVPEFLNDMSNFVSRLPNSISQLTVKTGVGTDYASWQAAILGLSKSESLGQAIRNVTTSFSNSSLGLLGTLTTVFGGFVSFILILVISFYLSVRESGVEDFLRLVSPLKHEKYIISVWSRTQYKIGKWMQGQLMLAVLIGLLVYIGLSVLNVPNALFFALIAAVFELIPVFGAVVGSIPGIAVAYLQGGLAFGVIVAIMYLVIQQIESNIVYPLVVQKILNVHPLLVIMALVVGARLGGFLGVLLSVPIAVTITELMDDRSKNKLLARERMSHE